MDAVLKLFNRIDWLLAAACLGYGAYAHDWRFAAAGCLSLCTAWYNPSRRMKGWLEKRLLATPKRRQEQAVRASAVRIAEEEAKYATAQTAVAVTVAPDYRAQIQGYGPVRLGQSKHNQLRPNSTNLAGPVAGPTWF